MKGIRKTAIASIRLNQNAKEFIVNNKPINEYFKEKDLVHALEPLKYVDFIGGFSLKVTGGGTTGQSGAVRYALSRTLANISKEYKDTLNKHKFLKCDTRVVERKKTGKPKARKSSTFVRR